MLQYEELRIRVRPVGPSHCLVAVSGPACALGVIAVDGAPAAFRARWDRLVAADLGLAPMGERHTAEQLRDLGRDVYRLLFGGDGGEGAGGCLAAALELAQRLRPPRGLRLRFDLPPHLRELPLEALCAPAGMPQQSLALGPGHSLARSLPGGPLGRRLPDPADEPSLIRLVVACASPAGSGPALRVDSEVAALRQELPEVAVRTTVVERATRERLESALGAHGDLPTAVLLIAHGTYDEDLGKGVVQLETEHGGADPVPADLLSGILLKAPRLRLAVLNLCSGADSSGPDGVHTEPFSGLAQALVGGGVPAVVAMRGRVSDVSAGRFSPELLKGLAANRTVDESMAAARRRISHLPRHTAVEWATPALFLHAGYRHGWLFKAREVRDDDGAAPDPLREGADALRAFQRPVGHVGAATLIDAARFERDRGEWAQVLRILRTPTRQYEDEQRQLRDEAAFELAWPELEALCGVLAAGRDGADAARRLAAVRAALPCPLPAGLLDRADRLRHAAELADRARAAEAAADWPTAIALYEQVLATTPDSPAPRARLTEARTRLRLATALATAAHAHHATAWPEAAHAYEEALALLPDDPALTARAAYARGRVAEGAGDWRGAMEAFGACTGAGGGTLGEGGSERAGGGVAVGGGVACGERAGVRYGMSAEVGAATGTADAGCGPAAEISAPAGNGSAPAEAGALTDTAAPPAEAVAVTGTGPITADRAQPRNNTTAPAPAPPTGPTAAPAPHGDPGTGPAPASPPRAAPAGTPEHPDISDAPARYAYARGRAAADAGDWATAAAAFSTCREAEAGAGATGHTDVTLRWTYARGRRCQELGDWGGAVSHLAALPAEFVDVQTHLRFSRGMFADSRGEWEGVIDGFGGLPDEYADGEVKVRRLYARARAAADGRGDWAAASGLLADLPDSARDGTVAPLRRKVEGRRAEAGGDWAAARAIYARAFTGGGPGGTLPAPRTPLPPHVPEPASSAAANSPATAAPAPNSPALALTPTARESLHLYLYALSRTHELSCRWADALHVYLVLPDAWADVAARRRYARARVAEEEVEASGEGPGTAARWRMVAAAYDLLGEASGAGSCAGGRADSCAAGHAGDTAGAGEGRDHAARAEYARVRAAEADGEWAAVVGAAEALGAYRDAPAVAAYARGRLADAHQEWRRAAEAFEECRGHGDADAHLAYARGRSLEAEGRWSEAVEEYGRAADRLDRADVRRRRLRRLIDLLPWADGATRGPLAADPFALRDETYPYRALRAVGVHPGVSMAAVSDASYTLLERGGMTWSERVAWDRLRLPGRRLQVDALLYRWQQPDGLRAALATLSPDDEHAGPGFVDVLCERFPGDAPLLLLLARGRDAATAEWERRLAAAPGDMATAHGLAVARLWQAQELEQSGAWEHAVRTWELALSYWATLLSDDVYWDGWRAERADCYERKLTHEDMTRLRWELSRHLFGLLSAYEQRHTEQDRPEQAAWYEELAEFLEAELAGARILKDVGGLPGVPGARAALACGPRYLRLLDLQLPLAELAADLDAAAKDGKDPGEYAVRELRWAFSGLSRALTLCAVHKFEPALRALPAFPTLTTLPDDCAGPAAAPDPRRHLDGCAYCQEFLRRDPAYARLPHRHARLLQDGVELAVRVRLELSRTALADGECGLGRAQEQWERLVRVARRAGMTARAKKALVRTVLGRVEALLDEDPARRGDVLDEAITLVEAVPPVLHPLEREVRDQLDGRLSSLYSMRGVWRGYTRTKHGMRSDVYGAEADLRRALALNPASNHARDNLARALVFTLDARTDELPARLCLLHEALGLLDVGLGQALTHNYRETLGESLEELDRLLATDLGVVGVGELMRSDGAEPPPDEDDLASWAAALTDRAEAELARGDVRRALHHLIRATRADVMDGRVRRALLDAVNRWLTALTTEGGGPS
ncbi:CHAT domain-containing protein [Streptomyces flavofungini]|uniref:CHAT domain-containing protein n=1 Tax=Streptomyces flavofungini TaxID=68200 RepID=UPI0025AECE65|nr:CHAT domain-containing protein [Streptomyces flavofungini]WJV45512.1 CHAT domain-containing protein [Streptomyces flavofungini]